MKQDEIGKACNGPEQMAGEASGVETHPFAPFIPAHAKVLVMGTFPPQPKRWAMDFYYPNRTNDFWFMMGLLFYGDRDRLYDRKDKEFRLTDIKELLEREGIAMSDTGSKVRRLKGNASDKFLEIVDSVDLPALLKQMPGLRAIATTGELAAKVLGELTDTEPPKMGEYTLWNDRVKLWRMPSTSRAYPLRLEKKAAYYAGMFGDAGCRIAVPDLSAQ